MDAGTASSAIKVIVVMRVSGSGKSTIASMLAQRLHWVYEDADWFHPQSNIEKMHHAEPLTDQDRWPWLHAIAAWIDATRRTEGHGVCACSALKRAYRDILIGDRPDVRLVFLKGDRDLIARRIAARADHFMPPALLDSQFKTLEEPQPDERAIVVSIAPPRERWSKRSSASLAWSQCGLKRIPRFSHTATAQCHRLRRARSKAGTGKRAKLTITLPLRRVPSPDLSAGSNSARS